VAPLEMNAGTFWGKNTIGLRGRSVEKALGSDFTFYIKISYICSKFFNMFLSIWTILRELTLSLEFYV
jgi:hypothetical protein